MLNKISINIRFLMLVILPTLILAAIGFNALQNTTTNHESITVSDKVLDSVSLGISASSALDKHYAPIVTNLVNGYIKWDLRNELTTKGLKEITQSFEAFNNSLVKDKIDPDTLTQLYFDQNRIKRDYRYIIDSIKDSETAPVIASETQKHLLSLVSYNVKAINADGNTTTTVVGRLKSSIKDITDKKFALLKSNSSQMVASSELVSQRILISVVLGSILIMLIGYLIARSINNPTRELYSVVTRLSEGEYAARSKIIGTDELSKLSSAFNSLLDNRSDTLKQIDDENKELNQSVFNLLGTVSELSERNLTIRANVTEDATGPVADALNILAEETADTLKQVKQIAIEVHQSSNKVNSHLTSINKLAVKEQQRAIETSNQMNNMMNQLDSISNSAQNTNNMANTTSESTKKAHESVSDTLTGMSDIRTTVQETGKRIKRLGERSQEISHVIEIIETIAERTTLLALNASMQAVAAGDEGKGFSVIAEEIQRLAESSRESTSQISTLVRNIQQETNTTIETMDKTIEQVIDGSMKAEDAVDQMQLVLETTSQLVRAVEQIAFDSKDQVSISKDLKLKSEGILKSTQVTGQELLSLTGLSRNMSSYAKQLVNSVDVFKLENENKERQQEERLAS